jgi:hypothetical protein
MHSSLMSSIGVRPEVTRDNMGHATIDVTQNVYNKTWWEERVEAVSMAAATVWRKFSPHRKRLRQCKPFCGSPYFSPTLRVSVWEFYTNKNCFILQQLLKTSGFML